MTHVLHCNNFHIIWNDIGVLHCNNVDYKLPYIELYSAIYECQSLVLTEIEVKHSLIIFDDSSVLITYHICKS